MVNLVKALESWRAGKSDQKLMKSLKKQLNTQKADINKLRQSTIKPYWMLAPIHAAIVTNNIEALQQILETKGVDVDCAATLRRDGHPVMKYGVIDMVTLSWNGEKPNIEVVKLLLANIRKPVLHPTVSGIAPECIVHFVQDECLDILDLLHSHADWINSFNPMDTLAVAVWQDKPRVFTHVLPEASKLIDQLVPLIVDGKCFTKLDMVINLARIYERTEMSAQLKNLGYESGFDINGNSGDGKNKIECGHSHNHSLKKDEVMNNRKEVKKMDGSGAEKENANKDENRTSTKKDDELGNGTISKNELEEERDGGDSNEVSGKKEKKVSKREVKHYCWNCSNLGKYTCTGCRKARYCGEDCQWEDWEGHKVYCLVKMNKIAFKQFQNMSPSIFD